MKWDGERIATVSSTLTCMLIEACVCMLFICAFGTVCLPLPPDA